MSINKRIVFADFSDKRLSSFTCQSQECFRDVENFLFNLTRSVDVEGSGLHHQKELFVVGLGSWETDHLKDSIQDPIYLFTETHRFPVVDDAEKRMTDPSVDQLFV